MDYKEKSSFVKWLDNVWYHYKTHIVIGAFALEEAQKAELLALNKQSKIEEKELKARAKAQAEAEKLAAEEAAAAEAEARKVIHPDFTELFDEKAYNDEKQAIADAEAKRHTRFTTTGFHIRGD